MTRLFFIAATMVALTSPAFATTDCIFYRDGEPLNDACHLDTAPNYTCTQPYDNPNMLGTCTLGQGIICTFTLPNSNAPALIKNVVKSSRLDRMRALAEQPGFLAFGQTSGLNITLDYRESSNSPALTATCE